MKNIFIVILVAVVFYGCTESSNPLNPVPDYSPMWPMPGYNARNTSSPYAPDATMNPVVNGVLSWSYTFPSGSYSDGSQFCVDSRGFIYYLHQITPLGALYKFSPDGQVVWKRDSLIQWNYAAISLSSDESKIYFVAFKQGMWDRLYCLDSAGKYNWYKDSALVTKPAIGKDGIIYSFNINGLIAVSPDGNILWTNTSVKGNAPLKYIALDREDNIYTISFPGNYVKVSKQGDIKWEYTAVNNFSGIVIDGFGNIYFTDYNYKLYCLNNSGKLKWTKPNVNAYSAPVITSDNRIIVSSGGYVISYDTSGTEIWRFQPFTNLTGAEGLLLDDADNVYYIGEENSILAGSITAVGVKRWEVSTNLFSASLPPPVLLPQGRIVVAPKRAGRIQAVN